ncbi:MAG TPA: S8 family serine peptidase [bacterium]|nr:S8 family serine peptidase [bacterium]
MGTSGRSTLRGFTLVVLVALGLSGCGGGSSGGGVAPQAVNFSVNGKITDASTSAAISGATVTVSAGSNVLGTATTDGSGNYALSNLTSNAQTVTWAVADASYMSYSTSLNIAGGGSFTVNYGMSRALGTVSGTVAAQASSFGARAAGAPGPMARAKRLNPALPTYVPGRIIVKFRPSAAAASIGDLHQQVGGRVDRVISSLGLHVVKLPAGASVQDALNAYRASGLVQYAEQAVYVHAQATPNDSLYNIQWDLPLIDAPSAWDVTTGSGSVIVAVVDTGIRSHPDLQGITVQGSDPFGGDSDPTDPGCSTDPNDYSHGMHVTGTIDADTNNGVGIAGINWGGMAGTKIMPIRALGELNGQCGTGTDDIVAQGITYAVDHGAKVINLSLGTGTGTQTLQDSVNYAYSHGVTVVAAAGNESGPVDYPAAYPHVIAVAATACDNSQASYSNFGAQIAVAAPGGDSNHLCNGDPNTAVVWSTSWSPASGNVYVGLQGTSMATPHVSGVVALMISRGTTGPDNILSILENTATHLGSGGAGTRNDQFGYGLINAAAAVGRGQTASQLRAFTGDLSGGVITVRSDIVTVTSNGAFTITHAQAGTHSVFVWQDFNGNGVIDAGDSFGETDGVVISNNVTTSGVAVVVKTYSGAAVSTKSVLTVKHTP